MSAPSPPPSYIYKILPNTAPYQGTPIPIPSDWEFPKTQVDLDDGFVHLSTSSQLSSTLSRFFSSDASVQLLKVDYKKLSTWKVVKWEKSKSNGESYPHLYGTLTGEFVVALKVAKRGDGEKESWEALCKKLEDEGWLEN